mgnify:FL=1
MSLSATPLGVEVGKDVGTAERRERERVALQKKIIDKGREILVNEGLAALTMRRLADEIEYTPGALYAHFADKDALVRAICQTDYVAFTRHFQSEQAAADPPARLRALAKLYARFALEHPEQYKTLFVMDAVPNLKEGLPEHDKPEEDAYSALERAVADAIRQGYFPAFAGRSHLVAQSLWAAMHGVVSIEIRGHEGMQIPFEDIALRVETICEVMLAGLNAVATAKSPEPAAPSPRARHVRGVSSEVNAHATHERSPAHEQPSGRARKGKAQRKLGAARHGRGAR